MKCIQCGGDEIRPGRFWHEKTCDQYRTDLSAAPPVTIEDKEARLPAVGRRGITFSPEDLAEMRTNSKRWASGNTKDLGEFLQVGGFTALQVLEKVMTTSGGYRSSSTQRIVAAKAFVDMAANVAKLMDALEDRREKTHRVPGPLRASSPQLVREASEEVEKSDRKSLN